jgi:hypothetical protein
MRAYKGEGDRFVSAMLQLLLSEFFYSLDGTDTLIETSAPALFVGHKPAEVDDPFALEGWLAFSFPFADATGELMTHEVCTTKTHSASVSRVSQPRVRFAATPPPVKNKQHDHCAL